MYKRYLVYGLSIKFYPTQSQFWFMNTPVPAGYSLQDPIAYMVYDHSTDCWATRPTTEAMFQSYGGTKSWDFFEGPKKFYIPIKSGTNAPDYIDTSTSLA